MRREHVPLLALHYSKNGILVPSKLQIIIFLFVQKAVGLRSLYPFRPDKVGPLCKDIFVDLDILIKEKFTYKELSSDATHYYYLITGRGSKEVKQVEDYRNQTFTDENMEYLRKCSQWAERTEFEEMMLSVCDKHPEMFVLSQYSKRANMICRKRTFND